MGAAHTGPVDALRHSDQRGQEAFRALMEWTAAVVESGGACLEEAVAELQNAGMARKQVRAELKKAWRSMAKRQGLDGPDLDVSFADFARRFEATWAKRRVLRPEDPDWMRWLMVTGEGAVRSWDVNLDLILRHQFPGTFRWNALASEVEVHTKVPWTKRPEEEPPRVFEDDDVTGLKTYCQKRFEVDFPANTVVRPVVSAVARQDRFDPLQDYLRSLKWDGIERCPNWLHDFFRVPRTDYAIAVGIRWLIQAVRRAFEPGCQADYVLVLEGRQGLRKSRGLRALAVRPEWFGDSAINVDDQRAAATRIQGKWIYELAEFPQRKSDADKLKGFLTNSEDRFREYYGRLETDRPRRTVFAATINPDKSGSGYLTDPTGARRFWPVKVTDTVDVEGLTAALPQLWAEAVARYRRGEPAWLEYRDLEELAQAEQADRAPSDPWVSQLSLWSEDRGTATTFDVLEQLCIPAERRTKQLEMRAANVLVELGYERDKRGWRGGRLVMSFKKPRRPAEYVIRLPKRRRTHPAQLELPLAA